jgi:ribosome maturation factor RimP
MSTNADAETTPLVDRVRALVNEVLVHTPHFVVELDVRGARGSQVVEVFIDSDEELDVDEVARVSREVGFLLDTEDLFPSRYHLNVSTPGVDRPLRLPRQYAKNVGRTLQVHYARDAEHNTEVVGTLTAAGEDGIDIALDDDETKHIPYHAIHWAKVQLPW